MSPLLFLGILSTIASSGSAAALDGRAIANQGWSLQAPTCPSATKSCGGTFCCPSASFCQNTGNGEVMACCPSGMYGRFHQTKCFINMVAIASNCRGSVEGSPSCADPAWSLWKGTYGNSFCCEVDLIGAFRNGDTTAGICVSSVPTGYLAAQLVSRQNLVVIYSSYISIN